jgi:hypothetical protein
MSIADDERYMLAVVKVPWGEFVARLCRALDGYVIRFFDHAGSDLRHDDFAISLHPAIFSGSRGSTDRRSQAPAQAGSQGGGSRISAHPDRSAWPSRI